MFVQKTDTQQYINMKNAPIRIAIADHMTLHGHAFSAILESGKTSK